MKIILLQDVKNLGKKGQVVECSDGYANNFIIPRRLGVKATERSTEILNNQIEEAKEKDEANRVAAQELAGRLGSITLEFEATAGKDGRMFGSVSSKQVVEELKKKYDISVDKRKFVNSEGATTFGFTTFKIELYKGVIGTLKVHVKEKGSK